MFVVIEDVIKETSSPLFRPLLFGDAGLRSKARRSLGEDFGSSVGYGSSNGSSAGPSTPTSGTSAWWHDFADNWIIKPGGGVVMVCRLRVDYQTVVAVAAKGRESAAAAAVMVMFKSSSADDVSTINVAVRRMVAAAAAAADEQ